MKGLEDIGVSVTVLQFTHLATILVDLGKVEPQEEKCAAMLQNLKN